MTSETPEMVERCVARLVEMPIHANRFTLREMLIACAIIVDGPVAVSLAQKGADLWLREIVQTVLTAMREPTEGMLQAGFEAAGQPSDWSGMDADIWLAMIDAARGRK